MLGRVCVGGGMQGSDAAVMHTVGVTGMTAVLQQLATHYSRPCRGWGDMGWDYVDRKGASHSSFAQLIRTRQQQRTHRRLQVGADIVCGWGGLMFGVYNTSCQCTCTSKYGMNGVALACFVHGLCHVRMACVL